MITRSEAATVADEIVGARVTHAETHAGVLVVELFHRGNDDGWQLAVPAWEKLVAE